MKITMITCAAGPGGVARPGTVIDLPNNQAEQLVKERYARPFDRSVDAKAPHGLQKPKAEQ